MTACFVLQAELARVAAELEARARAEADAAAAAQAAAAAAAEQRATDHERWQQARLNMSASDAKRACMQIAGFIVQSRNCRIACH